MTPARDPIRDDLLKHTDREGYECGGPHFRTPDSGPWCEPMGVWIAVPDRDGSDITPREKEEDAK